MLSALLQFRCYRQRCGYHSDARHVLVFSYPMRMTLGAPGVLPRTVACLITDGASGICDISFPVPTPYALHTWIPSSENSIFESRLSPSILYESIEGLVMESQRVTLSDDTPPGDRIASVICSGVSISCPEFR